MNSALQSAILAIGGSWPLCLLAKATLVMALGLWSARLAGKKRAAFRHAILAGMFGVLLALPVASAIAPPVAIALRSAPHAAPRAFAGYQAPSPAARFDGTNAMSRSSRLPAGLLPWAAWIAGMLAFLLPAALGIAQVLRLRRSGLPWARGQALAEGVAPRGRVRRHVDVLLHEKLTGPITCGFARPAILFPADAPDWNSGDLHRALVHELEHVNRRDWTMQCAARALCAVYWFHPLVWIAWRRLCLEAERACDDAVLHDSEPTAYADQLLAVARRLSAAAGQPFPAMAGRRDLSSRVHAVLDAAQPRGRAGASCVLATAAAAVLLLTVSPLRIVAAPQSAAAAPQNAPRARMRTEVGLVIVDVKVTDPDGKTPQGLGANDFEISENGVRQTIRVCDFQKVEGEGPESGYYLLGYYTSIPGTDSQFRKIAITVKNDPRAKVDYRQGYYAGNRSANSANPPVGTARSAARPEVSTPPLYDRPPVLLYKKEPEYTAEARKAKYQGTVLLDVVIDVSGRVGDVHVARSLGLGLDEKAIEAVKQWRFRPAMKDGRAVSAPLEVEVTFRLL